MKTPLIPLSALAISVFLLALMEATSSRSFLKTEIVDRPRFRSQVQKLALRLHDELENPQICRRFFHGESDRRVLYDGQRLNFFPEKSLTFSQGRILIKRSWLTPESSRAQIRKSDGTYTVRRTDLILEFVETKKESPLSVTATIPLKITTGPDPFTEIQDCVSIDI